MTTKSDGETTTTNAKPTASGTILIGSTTASEKETLRKPSVKKITKGSKRLTVTFNKMKNSGKVFYEIQYSTKKNFKKAVRIRAYQTKKINGKNKKVYSVWTKVKAVKTKK